MADTLVFSPPRSERNVTQTEQAVFTEPERPAPEFHILLVDDSEDDRLLFRRYLERTRSQIDIAENGEIGVGLFRTRHYDLILMDVEMPIFNGFQAVGEIRRIERETGAPPTPVLALTAHTAAEMPVPGCEAGFTDLLMKPIGRETLLEALAKYGGSKRERSLAAPRREPDAAPASMRALIEEGNEDIVPGYLEKRRADVAIYRKSLDAADFDAIRKLAHKMKGTGAGYGFPRLTELGAALEQSALESNVSAIRENLDRFAFYIEGVELE